MAKSCVFKIELGYFQRQELIRKIVRRFAKDRGWEIDQDINILNSSNSRICTLVKMAEIAITEIENEINMSDS